jgi:FkbM family methyltransferase
MIDASPENFRELTNAWDHLTLSPDELRLTSAYPFAMSSQHGAVEIHTNEDGSPLASIYPGVTRGWGDAGAKLSTTITVPTDTVDSFMARQRLDRVNVLKVDVEGHEMSVFEGAAKALADKAIDLVAFEFGLHQVQSRNFFVDFFDMFSGRYDYRMYTAENGVLSSIPAYSFHFENLSRQYVMYAVADHGPAASAPVAEPPPGLLERLRRRLVTGPSPAP